MAKVAQPGTENRLPARPSHRVPSGASPRLIEEASRIFLALGITATDLRLRARPGSPAAELADALDCQADTP